MKLLQMLSLEMFRIWKKPAKVLQFNRSRYFELPMSVRVKFKMAINTCTGI